MGQLCYQDLCSQQETIVFLVVINTVISTATSMEKEKLMVEDISSTDLGASSMEQEKLLVEDTSSTDLGVNEMTELSSVVSDTERLVKSEKKASDVLIEDETFICNECGYQFEGKLDFEKHLDLKECKDSLKNHIKKVHKCHICECVFSKETDLNSHTLNEHEKKLKNCGSCEMKFSCDSEVVEHTKDAHKTEIFTCYKCDYETVGSRKLEAHALLLHGIVKCDRCEYAAEDFDILNEHKKKHTGRIIFQCRICEFEATRM